MILSDFLKSVAQFDDPKFRRVLWRGMGLTIALLIAACLLVNFGINQLLSSAWAANLIGDQSWLGALINIGGVLFTIALSIWLMVPVTSAIIALFLDEVAQAVEARHYPHLPKQTATKLQDQILVGIRFFGILLLANIGALILSMILPLLAPFVFWATNGYLMGREYFQMAAMRRMPRAQAQELFQRHQGSIWTAGILMAIPMSIPLVGLFIPILGAATFTHQFERLRALPSG
ncbi:EI24 domain-containing protein [Planktomarina temperata]|uniref:EI24 domain-containing protein n=2 Tax=Paracoccaceae TaxID=31989 RepID=UPI002314A7AF|nr:EI24 domain-containing protein [Planktomarina temperata]MDB4030598.1 EI24 domain-containing protein [Planktomarina temperata]MDC0113616.1 EI24 domain-containing protein [Planktomarina temperata]MDC0640079.1 EI24 domain-containing protein [Planktomarina temperata]MDC1201838.1 EI24 domain-containing protein [Planktomarina temperata]